MKLAISNIAWSPDESREVAEVLRDLDVRYVEVAPTTIASNPLSLSDSDLREYRAFWEDRGVQIVAMQALLYGRNDLQIFQDAAKRSETIEYLDRIIRIGAALGAESLVFGSPGNRMVGDLEPTAIAAIESEFFGAVGESAAQAGTCFCLEPNPPEYGCDYLTTTVEALAMLERVGSPGLGLHLDAAAMTLAGETPREISTIERSAIRHFHISEPRLAPIGSGGVAHREFASALRAKGYDRYVSIEMRPNNDGGNVGRVRAALEFAREIYVESD